MSLPPDNPLPPVPSGNDCDECPGDPCTIVIFGASGDLTKRKLLPALYNLRCYGLLPSDFAIVGVARRDLTDDAFRNQLGEDMQKFATQDLDPGIWADFARRTYYCAGEFDDPATYDKLKARLDEVAPRHNTRGNCLFYLATPPSFFGSIVERLGAAGLATQENGAWRRVIIEKPFGHDTESALELNRRVTGVLEESQIYRIDHYLGKETVQNLFVFRFANGVFEPVWNRRYIDHVQITVAENIGVEDRGPYFEEAGMLRDVMQNHMLMLLALIAAEPPASFEAESVRNEKVKVLQAVRPLLPEEVLQRTVRGQYGPGRSREEPVSGYRSESRVSPTSATETFAAIKLFVDNWRWAGVPFYLRAGKRLPTRKTEIMIQFRRAPLMLFNETPVQQLEPNRLIMHIQPTEGITMQIKAKTPGPVIKLQNVKLEFNYRDFGSSSTATGYERLLYDCMTGDTTLFHRADMVMASWKIATPILDVWKSLPPREFPNYPAGSWGPAAADQLLDKDGRKWWNG
ncbi:MAG: glucose-6-phosphate dehydrogenase [Candidatus Sumerlaeaceae bacterium]|nr:glucose-6-phosphate dehydrogenase [Candidatus Sumerlaeaceae bacterium]